MTDLSELSAEQWGAASRLLDEALALPLAERENWLTQLAVREPGMVEIMQRLLAAEASNTASDRLSYGVPAGLLASAIGSQRVALQAGAMVGSYRLVRPLGQGGMASVWLAEQTTAVIRQVALKIPHIGLEPHAAASERFARERDLLAALEHERIARLYDAGVTANGVAFLAMEWIDGVPITRFCDEHQLSVDARLTLFRQVLDAVAFAHSRLVIHRDLKPSNILVLANGQVKLLDFGVANLLSDPPGRTGVAVDALTPDTASPEQLAGQPLGTTSDVYSLGIILYELLSGHRPYALDRASASLHAALMATTVGSLSEAASDQTAAARATSYPALRKRLRGELDAILARCLAKSPEDRFANVEALREDLERYAHHEPVRAYGSGPAYRLRCFVRRQRWPLAVAAGLLAVLLAGALTTLWQARAAIAQAQRAEAIQAFLLSLFRSSTPAVAEGHEITAKELLTRGSARVDKDLESQPRALAELHSELGDIFNEMGDDKAAMAHLQRAVAGFAALGLLDSRAGLEALFRRGTVYLDQSQWELARADLNRCIALGLAAYGPRHRWAVGAREKLAFILLETGDARAGIAVAREALAAPVGEDLENDALRRLRVKVIIGEAQTDLGEFRDARSTLTQAVAESAGPAGHSLVDRMVYRLLLVRAIFYSGDIVSAEPAAAELVRDEERLLGTSHPLVFPARQLWSNSLAALGHYDAAIDAQRATLRLAEAMTDANAERVALQRSTLSQHLLQAGRFSEAEPLAREANDFFHNSSKPSPRALLARRVLANVLLGEGLQADAHREIDQATAEARGIDNFTKLPEWAELLASAANVRRMDGDYAAALQLQEQACALLDKSPGASTPRALRCATERAWIRAMQVPQDAAAAAAFDAAGNSYAAALPAQHVARLDILLLGAELDGAAGRPARGDLAATRAAWRLALGGAVAPAHIRFLH
jgi:hypothetical protein